jgi:hypothetical protein
VTIDRSTARASSSESGGQAYGIYNHANRTVLTATDTTIEVAGGVGVVNVDGFHNESHATATLEDCAIRATGEVSSTQWVIGARNVSTSTLTLRRSTIHASGALAYTNGIYNISWATTNLWFSEVYADSADGVVRGIFSYRGAPFNVHYSTILATGGGTVLPEELAYGLYTDQGNQAVSTEILIRRGKVGGDDYATGSHDDNTSYTIKVIETWLEGTVDTTDDDYVCLGAHDGTNYLNSTCGP